MNAQWHDRHVVVFSHQKVESREDAVALGQTVVCYVLYFPGCAIAGLKLISLLFCFQANWLHANGGAEILAAIKGAAEAPQRVEVNVTADK